MISSLTGLELTLNEHILIFCMYWNYLMQTSEKVNQPYREPSSYSECALEGSSTDCDACTLDFKAVCLNLTIRA